MKYQFPIKGTYRITQKFGENKLDYSKFNLQGHNGLDIAVPQGTPILCPFNAKVFEVKNDVPANQRDQNGYGNYLRLSISDDNKHYHWVFGHLLPNIAVKVGDQVNKGQLLAYVDTTGFSTRNHLHVGVREVTREGLVKNYTNGYLGYIDPLPFFEKVDDEIYPVDERYGQTRNWAGFLREKKAIGQFTKKVNRLPNEREIKGLAYGYWDVETILNPAMLITWYNMHKPEYNKRLGK